MTLLCLTEMFHTWLLVVCLLVINLFPLYAYGYRTIVVSSSGNNDESCITRQNEEQCQTLDYVLKQISLIKLDTKDVAIIVEYSHSIHSVDIRYGFPLNITVLGVGEPSISCSDENGFMHFIGQEQTSVAISFDGVSFSGFYGYWDDKDSEWITGYAFVNFDRVFLRKIIFSQSSDVYFAKNAHLSIDFCWFHEMEYHYGVVYINEEKSNNSIMARNISNNTITRSAFVKNIGLQDLIQTPLATVGANVIPSPISQMDFSLHISDCEFQENYITDRLSNMTQISEVGIMVSGGKLRSLNVTVELTSFNNHNDPEIVPSRMVWMSCLGPEFNRLFAHINLNEFFNNSLTETGMLVSFYFSNILLVDCEFSIEYLSNNVTYNKGTGLSVEYSNFTLDRGIFIEHNNFQNNYGSSILVQCLDCDSSSNTVFVVDNNISKNSVPLTIENGIVTIENANLFLKNTSFHDNIGTALYVQNTLLNIVGEVDFVGNAGKYGGGLAMYGTSDLLANDAFARFSDNIALYGGAIYVGMTTGNPSVCSDFINDNCQFTFKFKNNIASTSGNNVFFEYTDLATCIQQYLQTCFNVTEYNTLGFGSSVKNIDGIYGNHPNNTMQVFPGQNIMINSSVFDVFGIRSTCIATVFLQCYDEVISCTSDGEFIQLQGPTQIGLGYSAYTSNIKLLAPRNISNKTFDSPSLRFQCKHTDQYTLYLDIIECPLGFVYNETACECQCALTHHSGFLCSVAEGKACVANGYWLGTIKESEDIYVTVVAHCRFEYCHHGVAIPCPFAQDASAYVSLGFSENDQCKSNHGGIMCANCRYGASFTFEGINCIDNAECQPWQPYLLLVLVILFQLILAYVIQLFLSIQTMCGIGFLSGPLFYLAVINTFPFPYFQNYYHLKTLISVFTSTYLLNMEVFGQIEWCFFSSFTSLENYAFHFLGPLIVALVLLTTVLIARKCPKLQDILHVSPLQAISMLLLMSFWSLSDTSVRILQAAHLPGVGHARVALQPNLPYFTGIHIPLAILSILIGVFIVYPFALLLLLAPFVSRKISLYRIQPLLDQFQSSYGDNFRWYPAVYMIGWLIIVSARDETLVLQTVLAIMLSMFFILRPYTTKWMNIANTFLLFDLVLVDALLTEHNNPYYDYTEQLWVKPVFAFLIYLLTILPLLYIIMGTIWIALMRFKITDYVKKVVSNRKSSSAIHDYDKDPILPPNNDTPELFSSTSLNINQQVQSTSRNTKKVSRQMIQLTESADEYCEPLVVLLQEEERQTGYGTSKQSN